MDLILLSALALVLGIASCGSCNRIWLNHNIKSLQVPSPYQIDNILDGASPQNTGTIMQKYGILLYFSRKGVDVSNYLYSFERTYPLLEKLYLTLPILGAWLSREEGFTIDKFLVCVAILLPFAAGWILSRIFIFRGYNEADCRPSERTPFPVTGGYEALEDYFDKEEKRAFHIIDLRVYEMERQKKRISRCNGIRIAVIALAFVFGLIFR